MHTNNGMKLALCSLLEEGLVTNITQFVHCKDYFNDVLFSEKFNTQVGPIHGFTHKPIGYFNSNKFYCIMQVTKTYYPNMKDILTINKFMKEFSEAHRIPTINVYEADSNSLLFEIPIEATNNIATFSIITNMIRLCTIIDGSSYVDFFTKNIHKLHNKCNNDLNTFKGLLSFSRKQDYLNYILFGGTCDFKHKEDATVYAIHNTGWQSLLQLSAIKINTSKYAFNEITGYGCSWPKTVEYVFSKAMLCLCTVKDNVITNIGSFNSCKDYVQDIIHQELYKEVVWANSYNPKELSGMFNEEYYHIMLAYNQKYYDRVASIDEMNSFMKTFSEIFRIPVITIERINDFLLLMKVPTVATEDKALSNCIFSMFRLILYSNGNYHETIEKFFTLGSFGAKGEKDSEIQQFRYNNNGWKDNYIKYLTLGGISCKITDEPKGNWGICHQQGWRYYVTQNQIKEMPVIIEKKAPIVKQRLQRVSVRSRHPSHAPLRGLLPRLPYKAVIRFGSTTELDADVEINSIQSVRNSADKLLMKQCFTKAGVKTANWFSIHDQPAGTGTEYIVAKANEIGFPIVAKNRFGSRGEGNYLLKSQEELEVWFKGKTLTNYIFEAYNNKVREYRLHVTKDGCVYTCRKMLKTDTAEDKRWFRNDSNSVWILEENELFDKPVNWDNIVLESVKALTSVGLDICSVDVKVQSRLNSKGKVRTNPDFIILETNSASSMGDITLEKYTEVLPNLIQSKYESRNI